MRRVATDRAFLDFIAGYWAEHETSPTVAEIGAAVGLRSKSSVHNRLLRLVHDGRLERRVVSSARVLYRVAA